jgi:hypothetical protein
MRVRSQLVRRSVAAVAGVTLAAGAVGVAGALQANAASDSAAGSTSVAAVVAAPTATIKADKTTAKAWAKVSLTGKTTGIKAGTTVQVQVQRLQSGKWVNFPATTKVTSKSTYSVWVQSGRVGVNKFRVVTGKAASAAVSVNVTK